MTDSSKPQVSVRDVLNSIETHEFHPLEDGSFTIDRSLEEHGIADLEDRDWRVRLLAVRDLVRAGTAVPESILPGLESEDIHVRSITANAAGVLSERSARSSLEGLLRDDAVPLVRTQAAIALGRIGVGESLEPLRTAAVEDESRDVRHQASLACHRIETGQPATERLAASFMELTPSKFGRVRQGDQPRSFTLPDTDGNTVSLSDLTTPSQWTVLIWIFADWCPVCHGEFDELIEYEAAFQDLNIGVVTIECTDAYRARVMTGNEVEPEYWFADEPRGATYADDIWWPHLVDRAGRVGAEYGVDPMAFAVHAEYINRPATVIIGPSGEVRFAYVGTYWGDRPTIPETIEMIRDETFSFEHPERRSLP